MRVDKELKTRSLSPIALPGTKPQDATISDIAREQRPNMSIFITLLGIATQDAIINDITWEQ